MLTLLQKLSSPTGGVLYVFSHNGTFELVSTDLTAEITAIQLWMSNGLDASEAGECIARQAIVDQVPKEPIGDVDSETRAIRGLHTCIQHALEARRVGRLIDLS